MAVWDAIDQMLAEGKDPIVSVPLEWIKIPPPKKRGRPKGSVKALTDVEKMARPLVGDTTRPRCLNPRCKSRLRSGQEHVCDEACRKTALMHWQAVVDLLARNEFPVEDVPDVRRYQANSGRVHFDEAAIEQIREGVRRDSKGIKLRNSRAISRNKGSRVRNGPSQPRKGSKDADDHRAGVGPSEQA